MISQEVQQMIEAKSLQGYSSPDEVVLKALKALDYTEAQMARLKAEVQLGIDQLDAGMGIEFNLDDFLKDARKKRGILN